MDREKRLVKVFLKMNLSKKELKLKNQCLKGLQVQDF